MEPERKFRDWGTCLMCDWPCVILDMVHSSLSKELGMILIKEPRVSSEHLKVFNELFTYMEKKFTILVNSMFQVFCGTGIKMPWNWIGRSISIRTVLVPLEANSSPRFEAIQEYQYSCEIMKTLEGNHVEVNVAQTETFPEILTETSSGDCVGWWGTRQPVSSDI